MNDGPAAAVPEGEVGVPEVARELAAGDEITPVWRNQLGGVTFRLHGERGTRYLKWQDYTGLDPAQRAEVDLAAEEHRLTWAGQFAARGLIAVPRVLDSGYDAAAGWLVTAGIDATPALDSRWLAAPETAVQAIASGLRQFHDALPVQDCPFTVGWVSGALEQAPAPENLVVCHGDPCVPNTLISGDGRFAAHVDLGGLGVADRWADLAIATYSISWKVNFGRSYDALFFGAYGVEPDHERIAFYRNLWDHS